MPFDLDDNLLILLSCVARNIRAYGDQLALSLGITRAQLIVLARLEQQPDISQIELAAMAEVTPITIARLIDRLEAQGMVERCPDPADRRIWRLRPTPAAAPLLGEINNLWAKLNGAATEGIDPAVLKTMAVGLGRMKANFASRRVSEPNLEEPLERHAKKNGRIKSTTGRRSA
jgi:DNA-binding MarR family transcriptional regulator